MTTFVRVDRTRQETPDVRVFELSPVHDTLPTCSPGSHIDVHLPDGMVRQYSLCNGPGETERYIVAVKRESASRGGSAALHDTVKVGDLLMIGEPRNNFALCDTAAHHVLVAGGIGITPMLSMAKHLLTADTSFELHYFTRGIAHTAFHAELSRPAYLGRVDFHYALEVDAVKAKLRRILWERKPAAHLYLCGPRPFMDTVQDAASATWPPDAVHMEYFAADAAVCAAPAGSFTVRLARTGGDYVVGADQTIMQALGQYGVYLDTSCEQGVCGTCLTSVLEGQPDHRDCFLTEDERRGGDKMLPCVSRAHSAVLVLDL